MNNMKLTYHAKAHKKPHHIGKMHITHPRDNRNRHVSTQTKNKIPRGKETSPVLKKTGMTRIYYDTARKGNLANTQENRHDQNIF